MNAEKKRNAELQKREKQLKAQIDNLITDSLGLLKTRLKELGIQAKTPPEFIEKAKGIVSSHHELQKNKLSLEREIRQLEAERDTLIASKEQELIEKYTKERKDLHPSKIREYVKRELEMTTNGMSTVVAPLLNKLSDVTFTKCSSSAAMVTSAVSGAGAGAVGASAAGAGGAGPSSISEQITTQIRKRPREQIHKQRDWPEKRAKTGSAADWPSSSSSTSMAKIEENNPEALAKKILEQGRSLEKSSHHRTSAATLTISPTKGSNHKSSFPPHHLGAPGVEVRKIEPPSSSPPPPAAAASSSFNRHPAKPGGVHIQPTPPPPATATAPSHPTSRSAGLVVDLPKIDISMSMGAATTSSSNNGPPQAQPPLVLPPHPDSRSQSSDHTDDLTFAKSKMSATPRAEQFEDRLKSIIHSVLSSDAPEGGTSHHPKARGPPPAAHSSHLPSPVPPPPPPPPQAQPQQPAAHPPPHHPHHPAPPAAHSRMLPSPSSSSSQQPGPMFSPVKRELPMHLPPPPSTHAHPGGPPPPPRFHHAPAAPRPPPQSAAPAPPPPPPPAAHHYPPVSSPYAPPTSSPYAPPPPPPPSHAHHMKLPPRSSPSQQHHHQLPPQQQQPPHHPHQQHHHPHRQSPSSHRTMGDLIAGELERNMPPQQQHIPSSQSRHHPPPPSPPAHSRSSSRPYVEPAGIPGNPREYLPRAENHTMHRMSQVIEDSIRGHVKASELEGLACPRTTKSPERERERERLPPTSSASSSSLRPPSSRADYPAMEGLAARFGPYMESASKRDRIDHPIPPPPPSSTTSSSQHRTLPPSGGSRGGLPPPPPPPVSSPMSFHDARRPPSASHSSRPPQPSALPSPPVLPPKKQHLDDHPDYRLPKGTVFPSITFNFIALGTHTVMFSLK